MVLCMRTFENKKIKNILFFKEKLIILNLGLSNYVLKTMEKRCCSEKWIKGRTGQSSVNERRFSKINGSVR